MVFHFVLYIYIYIYIYVCILDIDNIIHYLDMNMTLFYKFLLLLIHYLNQVVALSLQ